MYCWTVRWSFSTKTKASLALTPKQRAELDYIDDGEAGRVPLYGPLSRLYRLKLLNCHPDIFMFC
jgi:hypothetical protein